MNALEDLGFHSVDNFPPCLIPAFVDLVRKEGKERVALALDARSGGAFGDALDALSALDAAQVAYDVLFFDASDDVLVRRYSETRRRHPFASDVRIYDAIAAERTALQALRERAGRVWDTSHMLVAELRERIAVTYGGDAQTHRLRVVVLAFGYKHGIPVDADLVIDVRFLSNPNYVPELQPLTGTDAPVEVFMEKLEATHAFLRHLYDFVDYCIPEFIAEHTATLTIAIGCTGGRHRSVYIGNRLRAHLAQRDDVSVAFVKRDAAL